MYQSTISEGNSLFEKGHRRTVGL